MLADREHDWGDGMDFIATGALRRPRMLTKWKGLVLLSLLVMVMVAGGESNAVAKRPTGNLVLKSKGLPPGQQGKAVLVGQGMKRKLSFSRKKVSLKAGAYRIRVKSVAVKRGRGKVKKGAKVFPVEKTLRVRVRKRKTSKVTLRYGSVLNPGVVKLSTSPRQVEGNPDDPSGLILPAGSGLKKGNILTSAPSKSLPNGLVSRVRSVKSTGRSDAIELSPVPVTAAAPVIDTGGFVPVPGQHSGGKEIQKAGIPGITVEADIKAGCGAQATVSQLRPAFRMSGISMRADVSANPWGGGPKADLIVSAAPSFGLAIQAEGSLYCQTTFTPAKISFAIPVGGVPIPAYVAVPVTLRASLTGTARGNASYSWAGSVGMTTSRSGTQLVPKPMFSTSNSKSSSSIDSSGRMTVEGGVDIEAGVGVYDLGSIFVRAGTSIEATRAASSCHVDWRIGKFTAGGKVGPFTVRTADAYTATKRIWTGCGSGSASPGPGAGPRPNPGSPVGQETGVVTKISTSGPSCAKDGYLVSTSANGRFVAFGSCASNLVPDDTNGRTDSFVYDRTSGETERLSVRSGGTQMNCGYDSFSAPAISSEGELAGFLACGTVGDSSFIRDRSQNLTREVSQSTGCTSSGSSSPSSLSMTPHGDEFLFSTCSGLYLHFPKFESTNTILDCRSSIGNFDISDDGRYVVFGYGHNDFFPSPCETEDGTTLPAQSGMYLYDRTLDEVSRIDVNSDEIASNGQSPDLGDLNISGDGRYAIFASRATNLGVPGNDWEEIYLRDTVEGTTTPISNAVAHQTGTSCESSTAAISQHGRYIVFGCFNGDIYLTDRVRSKTTRISPKCGYFFGSDGADLDMDETGSTIAFSGCRSSFALGYPYPDYDLYLFSRSGATLDE
jgi:hypothetical protein